MLQWWVKNMVRMEEEREIAWLKFQRHQMLVKRWFDKTYACNKELEIRYLVLKWDKLNDPKGKSSKFPHLWVGPFQISKKMGLGTYLLKNLQGEEDKLHIKGQHLKIYFQWPHGVVTHCYFLYIVDFISCFWNMP